MKRIFNVLPLCIFLSRQLRVLGNIRHQCHQVLLLFLFRRLFSSKTLACRPQQYPPAASLWAVPTVAAPAAVPPSFCPVHLILPSQTGTWGLLLVYHEITLLCINFFVFIYLANPITSETKVAEVLVFPLQDLIVFSWLSQTVCTTSPMTILISNTIPVPLLRQPP